MFLSIRVVVITSCELEENCASTSHKTKMVAATCRVLQTAQIEISVFGQPFVKQFVLCAVRQLSVCLSVLSVLSVCNVGVLWPNSWMDQY